MSGEGLDGPRTGAGLAEDHLEQGWRSDQKEVYVSVGFFPRILNMLKSLNTESIVIPGGMTSMLQSLDVAIDKPFKDRTRKKWQE